MDLLKGFKIINIEGSWLELQKKEDDIKFVLDTSKNKIIKDKNGKEIEIKANKDKLFTATMPYSLETIRAFKKYPKEILDCNLKIAKEDYEGLLYTKLFVNLKFTKGSILYEETVDKETDEIINISSKIDKKLLRKLLYTTKLIIDGEEYCFFKRGGSKARTANVIFCKSKYKDKLYKPCLLGLEFERDKLYDLTSKEAYTSLIMSGIISTIDIKKEEILIIDDIFGSQFKAIQTITSLNGQGDFSEEIVQNNMTDGQGLMDESIYNKYELLKDKTCVLLRNDFLKCNVCRTKLQEYYRKNNITKVWDMYRGWIDASLIRLVITPSSCKYLKFKNQFENEKECFLDWLNKIPSMFGVVKTNHEGNYKKSYPLSYQMINSMSLSKSDVKELMKDELKYLKLLKDNTLVTKEELNKMNKQEKENNKKIRNDMTYFLNYLGSNTDELSTGDMINNLLKHNNDYRLTKEFKDYKSKQIKVYIDNLRLGKIRIKHSLYSIMISCPYTMLQATHKKELTDEDFIMKGNECYCPYFKHNEELMSIRNPQINAGNVNYMINKQHDEYKWFGYYDKDNKPMFDEVVFVNTYDFDLMNRLQGADFDIDTTYLTNNSLLVKKSKENQKWATPVNGIKGSIEFKKYNNESLAELDSYLGQSTMNIGKIVNKSAIFNAYMYDGIFNNKSQDYILACYKASSSLSSYSQIAIDMAKKSFVDNNDKPLSLNNLMNKLNKITTRDGEKILRYKIDLDNIEEVELQKVLRDELNSTVDGYERKYIAVNYNITRDILNQFILDCEEYKKMTIDEKRDSKMYEKYSKKIQVHSRKMIVPYFFKYTAQDNSYRIPTRMECGMDYLEEILDEFDTKAFKTDSVNIYELIKTQNSLDGGHSNTEKIDGVRKIITNCSLFISKNRYKSNDSEYDKKNKLILRKWAKNKALRELIKKRINKKTIHKILLRIFNLDENYTYKKLKMLNNNNEELFYINKETNEKVIMYARELYEDKNLVLTLIYNSYLKEFLDCFKENSNSNSLKKCYFWC